MHISLRNTFISHSYDQNTSSKIDLLCDKIISELKELSLHSNTFIGQYPDIESELFNGLNEMMSNPHVTEIRGDGRCSIVRTSAEDFTITLHGTTASKTRDTSLKGSTKQIKAFIEIQCKNTDIDSIQLIHKQMYVTPSFKGSPLFHDPDHDFHLKKDGFQAYQKLRKSGDFVTRYKQVHKGISVHKLFRTYVIDSELKMEIAKRFAEKLWSLLKTKVTDPHTGTVHLPYDIKLENLSVEMPGDGDDSQMYQYHIFDYDQPMFTPAKLPRICLMMLGMACGGDTKKFVDMEQITALQITVALVEILAGGKAIHLLSDDEKRQFIGQLNAEVISTLDPAIVPDDYAKICEMIVDGVFSARL